MNNYKLPADYNKPIQLRKNCQGYYYFTDKEHPLMYKSNHRVLYHRHMASLKIGKWIKSYEHVHHIDENKINNNINNLIVLTNSEHNSLHNPKIVITGKCADCGKKIKFNINKPQKYCSKECYVRKTKINWPSPKTIEEWVWREPTIKMAKELGVSDKAIDKFCKKHNIQKPPRGYWRKLECIEIKQNK